ncbi:hypothetical protein GE115_09550 [Agromyces sp. CFH 90414]|uniref:DUF3099 domain-containing protein n=1 Tax=Agromyces agglutinans TaxID=2662258 RepID=A0A6I2FE06_9MICO|nr:hypothetical protein [Agromyces agglutinans]MRG60113.1 hypothetical protein [Agromyces agglutinans]
MGLSTRTVILVVAITIAVIALILAVVFGRPIYLLMAAIPVASAVIIVARGGRRARTAEPRNDE